MSKTYIAHLQERYIEKRSDGEEWLQMPVNVSGHELTIKTVIPLTPYTEPDLDAIRNEAYEKGVQDTKQHWVDAPRSCAYRLGYENGLKAAWDVACKIVNMMGGEREYIFGHMTSSSVMNKFSATEAIEKIKQCGQEQEEIEYGDEIQFCDGCKALVLDVDDEKLSVVTKRGFTDVSMWKGNVTKTGEKYIIIADYLRKIRDGYEF